MFTVGVEEYDGEVTQALYGMYFATHEEATRFAKSVTEDGELKSYWINELNDDEEGEPF